MEADGLVGTGWMKQLQFAPVYSFQILGGQFQTKKTLVDLVVDAGVYFIAKTVAKFDQQLVFT